MIFSQFASGLPAVSSRYVFAKFIWHVTFGADNLRYLIKFIVGFDGAQNFHFSHGDHSQI